MTAPPPDCCARRTTPPFLALMRRGRSLLGRRAPRPRDAAAGGVAVEGYLTDFPLQSDDCIESLVEMEEAHMPVEGYLQKLNRRHGGLDLGAIRKDAVDWIWKVIEHYNFAPLTAVLSVNYLDRFLSTYELPEGKA